MDQSARERLSLYSLWKILRSAQLRGEVTYPVVDKLIMVDGVRARKALTIPMHVNFKRVTFEGDINFRGFQFAAGASFVDCHFDAAADFSHCVFEGHAYFWKCCFAKVARFDSIRVTTKGVPFTERFAGEANFSYCTFNERVDFERMDICGPTYLHRPIFRKTVRFDGSTFEKRFTLEGPANDICISDSQLTSETISSLSESGILVDCRDHAGYYNFALSIGSLETLSHRIKGAQQLRARKGELVLQGAAADAPDTDPAQYPHNKRERAEVKKLWSDQFGSSTLPPGEDCSFKGVVFAEESPFRQLHLDRCLFEGASVSKVDFVGVEWPLKRFRFWASRRQIAYDELVLDQRVDSATREHRTQIRERVQNFVSQPSRWLPVLRNRLVGAFRSTKMRFSSGFRSQLIHRSKVPITDIQARRESLSISDLIINRRSVSDLYHRLRVRHEEKGDRDGARDFYYGEIEMLRLSRPLLGRSFSLSNLYRLSSGYGKLEGLALLWLVVLVFALFPLLFLINNALLDANFAKQSLWGRTSRIELASLEASTFMSRTGVYPESSRPLSDWEQKLDRYRRVIEGCERIAVPLQTGLLLLAVKAKFKGLS